MLTLYSWNSPNAEKIHIALEELQLPCAVRPVDLGRGEQRRPDFLELNPAAQVPVLVDDDDGDRVVIFDSSAILTFLADRAGRLIPSEAAGRYRALSWLMFQGASIAANIGLFHELFTGRDTAIPSVLRLARQRVQRAYEVVERGLEDDYLAGEYSVADIACYAWLREPERVGVDRATLPRVSRWIETVGRRPQVVAGIANVERLSG